MGGGSGDARVDAHVQGHVLGEGEAVGVVEELIGGQAQVGEDGVYFLELDLGENLGELGEVGVEEAYLAGRVEQALAGEVEVTRIDIEADEKAARRDARGDGASVTGAAEGAVDHGLIGEE